jgi:CRP-like cAMP-binding protein
MSPDDHEARIDALHGIPLFARLERSALERVLQCANEVDVPAGQVFIQPHLEGSGLFVIEEGTAVVERGDKRVELGPGSFVGELALLTSEALRTARVKAKTDVRCLAISRYDFRRILEEEPALALTLVEHLAERLAGATS